MKLFIISTSILYLLMGAVASPAEAYRGTGRANDEPPAKEHVEDDRGSGRKGQAREDEDNLKSCFPENT